jgi:hypothetical protein
MIWFFEKNTDLMICEIRHSPDGPAYEFEIAPAAGPPETRRFSSASELLQEYLRKQSALQAQGWRPRLGDINVLG